MYLLTVLIQIKCLKDLNFVINFFIVYNSQALFADLHFSLSGKRRGTLIKNVKTTPQ